MQLESQNVRKLDYKWVVMAVSFLMVFTTLGFCSSNKSLYLKAITSALNIPRSLFSISDSCRYIATAALNLFFGQLVIRFGAKKLVAAGFGSLIISCLLYSFAAKIYVFYLGGVFLGIGLAWCTTTLVGYVVNKWFTENRGTVMGVILAANGLGAALSSQIVSPIIHDASVAGGFGYRNAYRLTALILLAVCIVVLIFFREAPEGHPAPTEKPDVKKSPTRSQTREGIEYSAAAKKLYFYVAAVCIFFTGATLQSISGVASAHLEDVGLDQSFVATALSLNSLMLAAAKILTGVSYDRLGLRVTVLLCDLFAAVAIFMLAMVGADSYVLATAYEIVIAFAIPLETVMLPLIALGMFGEHSYARIMGLFVSINTAGYAVGAPLTNLVYDMTGTYRSVLFILSGLMAVITVVFQLVLRRAAANRSETSDVK